MPSSFKTDTYSVALEDMGAIAQKILHHKPKIITLSGDIGAGKTTLTQQLLMQLGIQDPITSPTYAYVTTYTTPAGLSIFHFDLYRLTSLQDFIQAGFEEYLYQPNSLCIFEWPTYIVPLISHDACHVTFAYNGTNRRSITIEYVQ